MRLAWLPRALRDRDALLDYVAERSPAAAIAQANEIEQQITLLRDFPELGRIGRVPGTRELVIGGTRLIAIYRIRSGAEILEILRLLHSAQHWPAA